MLLILVEIMSENILVRGAVLLNSRLDSSSSATYSSFLVVAVMLRRHHFIIASNEGWYKVDLHAFGLSHYFISGCCSMHF